MTKNEDLFKKSLRLHICLPDVNRSSVYNGAAGISIMDDDSIVVYITKENAGKFFCKETLNAIGLFQRM